LPSFWYCANISDVFIGGFAGYASGPDVLFKRLKLLHCFRHHVPVGDGDGDSLAAAIGLAVGGIIRTNPFFIALGAWITMRARRMAEPLSAPVWFVAPLNVPSPIYPLATGWAKRSPSQNKTYVTSSSCEQPRPLNGLYRAARFCTGPCPPTGPGAS
jgi:hypothetical protein